MDRLSEHVFSFVRSLDRMGVTTLLTMPRAASVAASRLYKLVEDQTPISFTLTQDEASGRRQVIVNKYLGMDDKVGSELGYDIKSGQGIVLESVSAGDASTARDAVNPGGPSSGGGGDVRFSSAVFGDE
jgi:archaellum biogenesis ATPase FlaH